MSDPTFLKFWSGWGGRSSIAYILAKISFHFYHICRRLFGVSVSIPVELRTKRTIILNSSAVMVTLHPLELGVSTTMNSFLVSNPRQKANPTEACLLPSVQFPWQLSVNGSLRWPNLYCQDELMEEAGHLNAPLTPR